MPHARAHDGDRDDRAPSLDYDVSSPACMWDWLCAKLAAHDCDYVLAFDYVDVHM